MLYNTAIAADAVIIQIQIITIMVFICIAARMLDYTISATQDSAYNITQIII